MNKLFLFLGIVATLLVAQAAFVAADAYPAPWMQPSCNQRVSYSGIQAGYYGGYYGGCMNCGYGLQGTSGWYRIHYHYHYPGARHYNEYPLPYAHRYVTE